MIGVDSGGTERPEFNELDRPSPRKSPTRGQPGAQSSDMGGAFSVQQHGAGPRSLFFFSSCQNAWRTPQKPGHDIRPHDELLTLVIFILVSLYGRPKSGIDNMPVWSTRIVFPSSRLSRRYVYRSTVITSKPHRISRFRVPAKI